MENIEMCTNSLCRIRDRCWRYSGLSNTYWQSYTNYGEKCVNNDYKHFLPLENKNKNKEG